jgi:predicted RND superfamily exporter protein/outer membrane lipoprotein-sorting protein
VDRGTSRQKVARDIRIIPDHNARRVGGSKLYFQNDYRIFFSEDNPQLQSFEALQKIYTKDDSVLIVLHHPEQEVFSSEFLSAVHYVTEESWKLPFSTRVDSLTNFQHTEADGDDLIVEDLVVSPETLTEADIAKVERIARTEPLLWNRVVSDNPNTTGVSVTLMLPGEDMNESNFVAAGARELAQKVGELYPGMQVKLTGTAMLDNAFAEASMGDMMSLIPAMYVLISIIMAILLRSVFGTIASLCVVFFSTIFAIGLMGWLGWPMNGPLTAAPTMIMTLAVADSIHYLITFFQTYRPGVTKRFALLESMRINFQPITITSLTTAIGFLSLNFSDSPPFRTLGNVVAIGVVAAWLLSVVMLPAIMSVLPVKPRKQGKETEGFYGWIANMIIRRKTTVLMGTSLVTLALAFFVTRNELNDQFVNYFDERIEFRQDSDFTMDYLTGFYNLDYDLKSGESGGISNPEYLAHLEEFAEWFRAQPEVVQVVSLSDTMKRLNKNMHGDDPSYYSLPENRELAAQYLLLYEMSLPYGLDLNNQINVDKSATRLTVTVENLTTNNIRELIDRADLWLESNAPEEFRTLPASPIVMFAYISKRNVESMVIGTFFALVLISAILGVVLRSFKYGLVSLIPNLTPAVLGFGIWGLYEAQIGMSLAPVLGMTLGIVVDDTVHFLSKYLRARREKGYDAPEAVKYAFSMVGQAMVVTTIILAVGFVVLGTSSFQLNSWMGQLTAIVIVSALLFDFLFLPAFQLIIDGKKARSSNLRRKLFKPGIVGVSGLVVLGGIFLMTGNQADAQDITPEEKGLQIAIEADLRDTGYEDWSANLHMVLTNRHGQSSTREMRFLALETETEGDKRLSIFDSPRDVEGTAFLTYTYKEKDDDQWLYLPALKRVKRIASNNQSGPFVGSEFAYEDLASQEVEKYTYKYLMNESINGVDYYVVERYPTDENSGYTRHVVWIDTEEYRTHRVDYYDRKDELLKTLTMLGYQQYLDKFWRADVFEMVNHQTGKATRLEFADYQFKTGLDDKMFTKNALRRIR